MVGGGGAGREIIYLPLHCRHQIDFCIKMGSDESHFNVSVGSDDGQSHRTVSANHNLFEEKGEPKRYRTEVLPLSSLTPYSYAKPAHSLTMERIYIYIYIYNIYIYIYISFYQCNKCTSEYCDFSAACAPRHAL